MKYIDRKGNITIEEKDYDRLLRYLYTERAGRLCLRTLSSPAASRIVGAALNSSLSARLIPDFVKRNKINMTDYEEQKYGSCRDFLTRSFASGARPVAGGDKVLVSPCDGRLSVHRIGRDGSFYIKETEFTLEQLFRSKSLARRYVNGYAVVIRLSMEDCQRYCYAAEGVKSANVSLAGCRYAAVPAANGSCPIYKENTREYSLLQTVRLGTILMLEVGFLGLGRIRNHHKGPRKVDKGEEKGYFEFGGSAIVLFLQHGKVRLDYDLLENTEHGYETIVKMGERIGEQKLSKRAGKGSGRAR